MSIQSFTHRVVLVFAAASGFVAATEPARAGDRIYVDSLSVCDNYYYGQPDRTLGQAMCHKFRLHAVYFRRACCQRYVALPYTQPNSAIYYAPGSAGGYGSPVPQGAGPMCPVPSALSPTGTNAMSGYPVNYGYGPAPAFAAPGPANYR